MQTMKLIRTPAGWHVQTSDPKVRDLFVAFAYWITYA